MKTSEINKNAKHVKYQIFAHVDECQSWFIEVRIYLDRFLESHIQCKRDMKSNQGGVPLYVHQESTNLGKIFCLSSSLMSLVTLLALMPSPMAKAAN